MGPQKEGTSAERPRPKHQKRQNQKTRSVSVFQSVDRSHQGLLVQPAPGLARFGASYPTFHPQAQFHEQSPTDWWNALVASIQGLLVNGSIDRSKVEAIGVSGHSLGCVPIDKSGSLLLEKVPIWSDSRATSEARELFELIPEDDWYLKTGNGFPPALYTVFKVMWLRKNRPDIYACTEKILGTKDYVNFRLTGRIATDHSYASGTGVYDLHAADYDPELLRLTRLERSFFPEILRSTDILGELTSEAADLLGLPRSVKVVGGGVDNSCMALGAGNIEKGDVYCSHVRRLQSSPLGQAWTGFGINFALTSAATRLRVKVTMTGCSG